MLGQPLLAPLSALAMAAVASITISCTRTGEEPIPPALDTAAESRSPAASDPREAPIAEELAQATYHGIFAEPVPLRGGAWQAAPFVEGGASRATVALVDELRLTGDLDGDGGEEAVVLLSSSSGGSGTFGYLAVVGRRAGEIVNLGTAGIGDRVQVREASLDGGRVVLEVIQAGPGDAACCPSHKATRIFALGSEGLDEISTEIAGRLSLADLAGVEWVLEALAGGQAAPPEPEITLVLEGDQITGRAACNRYFADVRENAESPGDLSIGPIGSTRMACDDEVMALEEQYLASLSGAKRYGFRAGRLALVSSRDDISGTLLFASRELRD